MHQITIDSYDYHFIIKNYIVAAITISSNPNQPKKLTSVINIRNTRF